MLKRIIVVGGALLFLAVSASYSLAQEALVHGCYQKASKRIRMVTGPEGCKKNEIYVDWNSMGSQGEPGPAVANVPTPVIVIGPDGNWIINGVDTGVPATGPQGEQGPKGETGEQGPPGPGIDLADVGKIQDAICNIYDKTSVTPRPDFCPEQADCPCWPGVTVGQIVNGFETALDVADPVCVVSPGQQIAIGDNEDGDPALQVLTIPGYYLCSAYGLTEVTPDVGDPWVVVTSDEAQRCYNDLLAACGQLNWPSP